MKYSVTIPDDAVEAMRDAASREGISHAEYSRRALLASLYPQEPNADLLQARTDLERTREERDKLACDAAEVEQLRVDFAACSQTLKEKMDRIKALEVQTDLHRDQVQVLEERARAAELKAAMGEKDLELAEERLRSLQEVRDGLDKRIVDLRAMVGSLEGQMATILTQHGRLLDTKSRPWWAFWRI